MLPDESNTGSSRERSLGCLRYAVSLRSPARCGLRSNGSGKSMHALSVASIACARACSSVGACKLRSGGGSGDDDDDDDDDDAPLDARSLVDDGGGSVDARAAIRAARLELGAVAACGAGVLAIGLA